MTTADSPSPLSRAMTVLAHSIPGVIIASVVVRLFVYTGWFPALGGLDAVLTMGVLIAVVSLMGHLLTGGLCLRCVRSSPLNPELSVRRNRLFLWEAHLPMKTFLMGYFALVALSVGGGIAGWGVWSRIPLDAAFYVVMWSVWAHHRLQPWCPWCRGWDEGGDPELVPDPDPSERATR